MSRVTRSTSQLSLLSSLFALRSSLFSWSSWPGEACIPSVEPPARPPPRAIWTDVRPCYPWETPLPHSTKNNKKHFLSFLFSLLSFLCSLPSALEAARGPSTRRHGQEKGWPPSGGFILGHLAASWGLYSVFSLMFVVLVLRGIALSPVQYYVLSPVLSCPLFGAPTL